MGRTLSDVFVVLTGTRHLLRKTWDRRAQTRIFGHTSGPNEEAVIIDYGQKVEPMGQVESQSECFGKVGISQFVSPS